VPRKTRDPSEPNGVEMRERLAAFETSSMDMVGGDRENAQCR